MHPSFIIPPSLRMAAVMPVAIARALRSVRKCAPAAGMCITGASHRDASGRKRSTPRSLTPEEYRANT